MQALQNLHEYLLDAESQLGTDNTNKAPAQYVEENGNKVPVAAGAGDTNICGGIIQLYWNHILERCLDANDQVRQFALKVLFLFLTCIPALALPIPFHLTIKREGPVISFYFDLIPELFILTSSSLLHIYQFYSCWLE